MLQASTCALLILLCYVPPGLAGSELKVDWKDPELQKFSRNAKARSRSIVPGTSSAYIGLKLPVIGLKQSGAATRGGRGGQASKPPNVLMNKSNPVWYELIHEIEDGVTATISADLRIQSELPKTTRTYSATRSIGGGDDEISVFDDRHEVGLIGAVAEFTMYKFGGVPYVVTVECTELAKARCRDLDYLKRLRSRLEVLHAEVPG